MREKVLILYGGPSVEHDISIITALQAMRFLPKKFDFLPIYIDRDGVWWTADNLKDTKIYQDFNVFAKRKKQVTLCIGKNLLLRRRGNKFVFLCEVLSVLNCCHGRIGEDGCLQGVCESCDIAYTSCDEKTSAICMDKVFVKDILEKNDIETAQYVWFDGDFDVEFAKKDVKILGYPVVVKPANLGSSIGISVCKTEDELEKAFSLAKEFDDKILVEKLVSPLREFNCACLFYKDNFFVSKVNEVSDKGEIYSFEDKYIQRSVQTKKVDKSFEKKIKKLTENVYKLLGCRGVVRVDFLFDDKEKKLYVNEINTIPGSLAFYLFENVKFSELIECLIDQSLEEKDRKSHKVTSFESGALKIFEAVKFVSKK